MHLFAVAASARWEGERLPFFSMTKRSIPRTLMSVSSRNKTIAVSADSGIKNRASAR